jgi:hypothetical protein
MLAMTLFALLATPPKAATHAQQLPQMSDALVATLLNRKNELTFDYILTSHPLRGPSIGIMSNRTVLVDHARRADVYVPPASARIDVVTLTCGVPMRGAPRFCKNVVVKDPAGATVRPLQYNTRRPADRIAFDIIVLYPVAPLKNGFTVTYADLEGGGWTWDVTQLKASSLLLDVEAQ